MYCECDVIHSKVQKNHVDLKVIHGFFMIVNLTHLSFLMCL